MKIVHASPGFGLKLTQEQTIEFLTDKKQNNTIKHMSNRNR